MAYDYTNIDNPFDAFVDRSIESEQPINPDQPIREGSSLKDVWITSFIRSVNWKPRTVGFNIDGETGDAEFHYLQSHSIKMLSSGGTNGTFTIFRDATNYVLKVNSTLNPLLNLAINPNNGAGTALSIIYPVITAGLTADMPVINIEHQLSNVGSQGINITIDAGSAAHSAYGIKMNIAAASGTPYAFWFNGTEIVSAAVGGSQDKKIRIKIGSTTYFIPCHTA